MACWDDHELLLFLMHDPTPATLHVSVPALAPVTPPPAPPPPTPASAYRSIASILHKQCYMFILSHCYYFLLD